LIWTIFIQAVTYFCQWRICHIFHLVNYVLIDYYAIKMIGSISPKYYKILWTIPAFL
jgi:hypothetical protein